MRTNFLRKVRLSGLMMASLLLSQCENFFSHEIDITAGFYDESIVSISKYVAEHESYSYFYRILEHSDMLGALASYNPEGNNFTLFLPSNDAIENYIKKKPEYSSFNDMLSDSEFIISVARYHTILQAYKTIDFPFGALSKTNASEDYLTISFDFGYDTITKEILFDQIIYKVNGVASIVEENIILNNGIIHVIDQMMEPIFYSSYDWLLSTEGFSIITEVFEMTGLKDTMGIYRTNSSGKVIDNIYTLLVEHDSIFNKRNVYSANDLINIIVNDPAKTNYTDENNPLYQYAAYHIMEGRYFLDAFENQSINYNTFAHYPINIRSGMDFMINKGSAIYDTLIVNMDTTYIDYIKILYTVSNRISKNGAIHFVNDIIKLYKPSPTMKTIDFVDEEPILFKLRNQVGVHPFFNDNDFEKLKWEGVDIMEYVKESSSSAALKKDFIRVNGDFHIKFTISKILAGSYNVIIRANSQNSDNSTIQVFIDGKRIGSSFNLSSGGNPYRNINVGNITFVSTDTHLIEIRSLIPGRFEWDMIRFTPN